LRQQYFGYLLVSALLCCVVFTLTSYFVLPVQGGLLTRYSGLFLIHELKVYSAPAILS